MVGCLVKKNKTTTVLKCNIADCPCEQFFPGNGCLRSCDECKHSFVHHVLNLTEFESNNNTIVKHLTAEHIYQLCTLCLYGTTAISPRIKILLDRLLETLTQAERENVLKSLKWTVDDYEKSYIEHNFNNSSSDFHLIMPSSDEEDQFLLPQFLRLESTRLLAQYFLQIAQQQQRISPRCPSSSNGRSPSPSASAATESKPTAAANILLRPSLPPPLPPPPPPPPPPAPFPFVTPWPSTSANEIQMMNFLMAQLSNPMMYDFRRIGNNLLSTNVAAAAAAAAIPPINLPVAKEEKTNGKHHHHHHHYELPEINNNQIERKSSKRKRLCSPLNLSTTSRSPPSLPPPRPPPPPPPVPVPSDEPIARLSDSSMSSSGSTNNPNTNTNNNNNNNPSTSSSSSRKRFSLSEQRILISPHGKKRVQCNVCMKTFCDKGALKIHFSAVHLREMHRCTTPGCTMMFSSRRSRNRHSANPNPKLHLPRPNAISHRYHSTGPIISDGKHQSQVNLYLDDDDDDDDEEEGDNAVVDDEDEDDNISSSIDDHHDEEDENEQLVS